MTDSRSDALSGTRRVLSLWFPRLAAERVMRGAPSLGQAPLAIVGEVGSMRVLTAVNAPARLAGLSRGQALAEASAICPDLLTRPADPLREAEFLGALRRWAGKFSPWVAEEGTEGLLVDLTGCAHLFGGELALFRQVHLDCADLGLSVAGGIADTAGAAWALARHADDDGMLPGRNGDAIDQEARATRSRAARRHRAGGTGAQKAPPAADGGPGGADRQAPMASTERGRPGTADQDAMTRALQARIAPPGRTRQALAPLPIAALRLDPDTVAGLARLGLRRIGELSRIPRGGLTRRFGQAVMLRLDQALGLQPEPITPAGAPLHFAVRLSLPEPIGLEEDILAGLDRLLPALCDKLRARGRGARRVRLEMAKAEGGVERIEIGLARPADRPDKIRPLFDLKLDGIDAGFGFDSLRAVATATEPAQRDDHKGGWAVTETARARAQEAPQHALDDLIARIGARVGLERILRERPADSHIPEKTSVTLAAAWSEAETAWPDAPRPRPLTLFRPEPVTLPDEAPGGAPEGSDIPARIRWRGRVFDVASAYGPERLSPEWWLDDPAWRSGVRNYWRVITTEGRGLWLFYAYGETMSGGWFAQGDFN